jgi:hypothetical protein
MVDGNLAEWYATLPSEWKHSTIGVVSEMPVIEDLAITEKWPGEQHIYNDVPLASIVNDYRVCRIFCRRVIIACLNWLSISGHDDETGEYNQSVFVIQQMVDDISACVPFHLDYELQVVAKEMGQEQNGKPTFSQNRPTQLTIFFYSCGSFRRLLTRLATVCRCKCRDGTTSTTRLAFRSLVCYRHEIWAE